MARTMAVIADIALGSSESQLSDMTEDLVQNLTRAGMIAGMAVTDISGEDAQDASQDGAGAPPSSSSSAGAEQPKGSGGRLLGRLVQRLNAPLSIAKHLRQSKVFRLACLPAACTQLCLCLHTSMCSCTSRNQHVASAPCNAEKLHVAMLSEVCVSRTTSLGHSITSLPL